MLLAINLINNKSSMSFLLSHSMHYAYEISFVSVQSIVYGINKPVTIYYNEIGLCSTVVSSPITTG